MDNPPPVRIRWADDLARPEFATLLAPFDRAVVVLLIRLQRVEGGLAHAPQTAPGRLA